MHEQKLYSIHNISSHYHSDHYVYYIGNDLDFIQDAIMPVSTAVTATSLVLLIVKTTYVTYKVERVLTAILGGLMYIVITVRPLVIVFSFIIYHINNILFLLR